MAREDDGGTVRLLLRCSLTLRNSSLAVFFMTFNQTDECDISCEPRASLRTWNDLELYRLMRQVPSRLFCSSGRSKRMYSMQPRPLHRSH